MNKFRFLCLFLLVIFIPACSQAQFNSDLARKSIVRIYVRVPGESKQNVCTGFMWKQASHIITSLHGMKAGAKITVVYPGKELRPAKIVRIIKDPDLVMLETANSDGSPLNLKTEAIPLTDFAASTKNEMLHALGFWSDAASSQVIDIKHADFDPEKLDGILPEQYKKQIIAMTFPSIYDPIYGLNGGSLLPGFSGSPVFNSNGNLVSVGDGGIEAGALDVSWSIPASNLDRLSASNDTVLPPTITHVPFLYSAEVSIPVDSVPTNNYNFFQRDDISLYQTKTRTYTRMKETAWDTFFMDDLERSLKFYRAKVNYDSLNFDVYQIPGGGTAENPGFVVIIPAGTHFYSDTAAHCIRVDLRKDSAMKNFGLYYFKLKNEGKPKKQVREALDQKFGKLCGGFAAPPAVLYLDKGSRNMYRKSQFAGGWQRNQFYTNGNLYCNRNGKNYTVTCAVTYVYNNDEIFCTVVTELRDVARQNFTSLEMGNSLLNPYSYINEKLMLEPHSDCVRTTVVLNSVLVFTAINNAY